MDLYALNLFNIFNKILYIKENIFVFVSFEFFFELFLTSNIILFPHKNNNSISLKQKLVSKDEFDLNLTEFIYISDIISIPLDKNISKSSFFSFKYNIYI